MLQIVPKYEIWGHFLFWDRDLSTKVDSIIIAPQAQLEESANDRSKPEVLISRVLKRICELALVVLFDVFANGICVFDDI